MKTDDKSVRVGVDEVQPWTLTHSGIKMFYLEPTLKMLSEDDIVHHTSNICRFTGAVSQFYSVAQHSVFVAQLMKKILDDEGVDRTVEYWDQILAALIHDAAEYIVNDIATPLKKAIRGKYDWIEMGILRKIFELYGVDWLYHNASIKTADNMALQVERYYLMPDHPDWPKVPRSQVLYAKPKEMGPAEARTQFKAALQYTVLQRNSARA